MPNYANAKIYQVISPNYPLPYIGSTTMPLCRRMVAHRAPSSTTSCRVIIEAGDAYIELIEEFPCENKEQLNRREGEVIREKECVNRKIEGRTDKEYRDTHKEQTKIYREANKEKIEAQRKARYEANCESIRAKQRAYQQAHREERVLYNKAYRKANKEEVAKKQKAYREANREKYQAYHKEYNKAYYQSRKVEQCPIVLTESEEDTKYSPSPVVLSPMLLLPFPEPRNN